MNSAHILTNPSFSRMNIQGLFPSSSSSPPVQKRHRRCQLNFCRRRTTNWRQLGSMAHARQIDFYLGLDPSSGAVEGLRHTGFSHILYICAEHWDLMQTLKQMNQVGEALILIDFLILMFVVCGTVSTAILIDYFKK